MKIFKLLSVLLVFLLVFPFASFSEEPLSEPIAPDPIQAANNFITGLTGQTPSALGLAGDVQDLVAIGDAVINGDFSGAANKLGEFTAGKFIGYTAPAIGQIIAIGNIGKMAGDAAAKWVGQKNFEKIYNTMLETVGPVEQWPKSYTEAKRDEFFQATMAAEYRYLETYLMKQGYAKNRDEAEKVAVEMILAKGQFERLCNKYGLEGKDRTYENLKREIESEAQMAAEIAREKELARVEELKKEQLVKEEPIEEDLEAELAQEMAALEEEKESQTEAPKPEQKPQLPKPEDTVVVNTDKPKPDEKPVIKEEPKKEPKKIIAWTIAPSAGDDQTAFTITVTNLTDKPIKGFSSSVEPLGAYSEGGVGWGSSPSFSTIAPGASISFVALAMGDVEGLAISFSGNGTLLGGQEVKSIHRKDKKKLVMADGKYSGTLSGGGIFGRISISIKGEAVSGSISAQYSDAAQNVRISGGFKGSFDPDTGAIYAKWSGIANGTLRYEGETMDVNEPVYGVLNGVFKKGVLAGSWSGGSEYIETEGSWQAR